MKDVSSHTDVSNKQTAEQTIAGAPRALTALRPRALLFVFTGLLALLIGAVSGIAWGADSPPQVSKSKLQVLAEERDKACVKVLSGTANTEEKAECTKARALYNLEAGADKADPLARLKQCREQLADEETRVKTANDVLEKNTELSVADRQERLTQNANGLRAAKQIFQNCQRGAVEDRRDDQRCERVTKEIDEAASKAKQACSKAGYGNNFNTCFDSVMGCNAAMEEVADETFDSPTTSDDVCQSITTSMGNSCAGLSVFADGRDYRDEEKEAERDRKEAKGDLDDLLNKKKKLEAEIISTQKDIQEQVSDAQYSMRQQERKVAESITSGLEGVSDSQKKAFADAARVYEEMDAAYIGFRKEKRLAANAVADVKDELESVCRATADKKFREAEAQRVKNQKTGRRNVVSATNLAGRTNRKNDAQNRARSVDYMSYYNECMTGVSPEGTAARNKIKSVERQAAAAEAEINDKSAMIEKKRQQMLTDLQKVEAEGTTAQSKIIEQANKNMQSLNEQYNRAMEKAQSKMDTKRQEQALEKQQLDQKLATASQEMQKHEQKSLLAKRATMCTGRAGRMKESAKDRANEGFGSALSEMQSLRSSCLRLSHMTMCLESNPEYEELTKNKVGTEAAWALQPQICKEVSDALDGVEPGDTKRRKNKRPVKDVKTKK